MIDKPKTITDFCRNRGFVGYTCTDVDGMPYAVWEQYLFRFKNGYGASVVRGPYICVDVTKWEIAVLRWHDTDDFGLEYHTPITNDVIKPLDVAGVKDILTKIRRLPPWKKNC